MRRSLLTAAATAATLAALAGCGSAPSGSATVTNSVAATPAAPGTTVAGIPALGGNATDLKAAPQIPAGTGQPPTQLLTQDVVVGTGAAAAQTDTVNVRYSGTLYDGTPFDSSWSRGDAPISFPLDQVVPGFAQGIQGMKPGGRRVIVIPPTLGYGDQTKGPIPGGSTLVFVADLVGIG